MKFSIFNFQFSTLIVRWILGIVLLCPLTSVHAWPKEAQIKGSTTNGNLVVFGPKGVIQDSSTSVAQLSTTNDLAAVEAESIARDALKVDVTNGVSIGTNTLQQNGAITNYVTRVVTNNVGGHTNGLVLITKVYNGATNTYYDLTD